MVIGERSAMVVGLTNPINTRANRKLSRIIFTAKLVPKHGTMGGPLKEETFETSTNYREVRS